MKKKKLKIIIPCIIIAVIFISAIVIGAVTYYMNNYYKAPSKTAYNSNRIVLQAGFTDIKVTDEQSAVKAVKSVADQLGVSDEKYSFSVYDVKTNMGKIISYEIQEYYDGYPVYNGTATVWFDLNGDLRLTSEFEKINDYTTTNPSLSNEEFIKWQEKHFKMEFVDYDTKGGLTPAMFGIKKDTPIFLYKYDNNSFVTAFITQVGTTKIIVRTDGKILEEKENDGLISDKSVICYNSDGSRKFNGYYNSDNKSYEAYDNERNITIWTLQKKYNSKNKFKTAKELISNDEYFGNTDDEKKQEYEKAVIFMNNISKIYDYYKNTFSETGYGELLLCYNDAENKGKNGFAGKVEQNSNNIGALYIGYQKSADDIDLLAHEYTHIVTSHKIKWADNTEKWGKEKDYEGALKEAYSDIFAIIIDSKINRTEPDWIFEDRNVSNPKKNNYPANINDKEWKWNMLYWVANGFKQGYGMDVGNGNITDYAHGFSTVISHSAYLMWNGIDGNESKKIDIDKLAEIWYKSLDVLSAKQSAKGETLTAVTFEDCANAVLISAKEMQVSKSITSEQYSCVTEAFEKVGISIDENKTDNNTNYKNFYTDNSTNYKNLYNEYVNKNIVSKIGICKNFEQSFSNIPEQEIYKYVKNNKGLASVYIEDFNNDNIPEMVTVSALGKDNGFIKIEIKLYAIENNSVIDKGVIYETKKYDNADEPLYVYIVDNNDTKYLCLSDRYWYGGSSSGSTYGEYFKAFSGNRSYLSEEFNLSYHYNQGDVTYKVNGKEFLIAKDGAITRFKSVAETEIKNAFSTIGLNEFSGADINNSKWIGFPKNTKITKILECGTQRLENEKFRAYLTDYTKYLKTSESQVSGTVQDSKTKKLISNVTIKVLTADSENPFTTIQTDETGTFQCSLPNGNYTLVFSYDNYDSYEMPLEVTNNTDILTEPVLLTSNLLTDKEAEKLWKTANQIYNEWMYWIADYYVDENDTQNTYINEDGQVYFLVKHDTINSVNKLKKYLANYFDSNIYDKILEYYINYNGHLYCNLYPLIDIGADFSEFKSATIKSQSGKKAVISLKFLDEMFEEETFYLEQTIELRNGKWIFTNLFYRDY